ncbi:MAG: UDP-4-amino-4-deoxy-L-arabinose--oxoglutarate aminotransferase [Syntrophorhabdus sp. PtaU1.Bin002]|nr:MAG: UDP-4-amino-4-deoxy-L-arabinose--oxoglutarate aminotransferase [Syntrophorhabdus sp. PtaU1.Bin002]
MTMKVPFAIPECEAEEIQEVTDVIRSGWLTTASRCAQFEKNFAEYVGAKHALAVNSATAALHLGLEALGTKAGDKVLVPTFTFTATAEVVRYLGAEPVFVDCDRETFCITRKEIEKAANIEKSGNDAGISLKTIIPVHFGGHPCEMDSILAYAEDAGLRVMEDAAHAIPTRYKGRLIGVFGDVTCFSFYANKTMTTGEGGMLCTDNDEIAARVKVMRLHGINRDVWDRFSTGAAWEYDVVAPGFKYNMPDLNAALGIHQLKKVEFFREKRERIAKIYYEEFGDIPGLILPRISCDMKDHSWYIYNVLIDRERTRRGLGRDEFIAELTKRNIGTSVHYRPLHRMTYYKTRYNLTPEMFPNAEWIFEKCVSIPMFSAMTDLQLKYVIESVKKILS